MTEKNLGVVSPVPKGEWNQYESYQQLNIVRYNSASYIAKMANKGILPTNSDYWLLLVVGMEENTVETIKNYSSIAEQSATQAASSATAAAQSETNAQTAETNATQAATQAQDSANAAAISASQAQNAATQNAKDIDNIYTILGATVTDEYPLSQAYSTRETADGNADIIDGALTRVTKIQGATVATTNLFKEEYVAGVYVTSNGNLSLGDPNYIGTKKINVAGNTDYYVSYKPKATERVQFVLFYDKDDKYISYLAVSNSSSFKTPQNCVYIAFDILGTNSIANVGSFMLNAGTTAKPYRPYFSGLKNAYFKGIISTGRNLINPNGFEQGAFDQTTGLPITGVNQFRTVYNIPCSAGAKIVQSNAKSYNMRAFFYGVSGNYISTVLLSPNAPVTAPSGSSYIKVQTPSIPNISTITTDKYQLEYGTATEYEPYKADESFMLDEAVPLGAYDYIDIQEENGIISAKVVEQEKTLIITGDEVWGESTTDTEGKKRWALYLDLSGFPSSSRRGVVCNYYDTISSNDTYYNIRGISVGEGTNSLYVYDEDYSSGEFKTHLKELYNAGTPLTIAYQTEQPIDETDLAIPTDKYKSWVHGSETQVQGDTDNSADGANCTVSQDYYTQKGA